MLCLAAREPDTSAIARILIWVAVAYLVSPTDLIPDFIPLLGILDDLIIVPLLIVIIIKLIPDVVWQRCSEQAKMASSIDSPWRRQVTYAIVILWLIALLWLGSLAWRWLAS